MPRAGFEPVTPSTKRSQTYALDGSAKEKTTLHKMIKLLMLFNEIIRVYSENHKEHKCKIHS
jgi:hypothetical protein